MKISLENASFGNRAMASVLLLYYHLIREGGITNDQTVYVDALDFVATELVSVEVDVGLDIDQSLLREGACISLVCDLNDWIAEESHFLESPKVREIIECFGGAGPACYARARGVNYVSMRYKRY